MQRYQGKQAVGIDTISVKGFRSIRELNDLHLGRINVLVGANGSGKSNFVRIFDIIRAATMPDRGATKRLSELFQRWGGVHPQLYRGPKTTKQFELTLWSYGRRFHLEFTPNETGELGPWLGTRTSHGTQESEIDIPSINKQMVFHFHDTSPEAGIMGATDVVNRGMLLKDGRNLAAVLLGIKEDHPKHYKNIVDTIRLVAPSFSDFVLVHSDAGNRIRLGWNEIGLDDTFGPHRLSDGTLRFICLATLLLQPDPPPIIVIDEPELGLHPYALSVLSGLVKSASAKSQLILATHSVELINEFEPEDVIVVENEDDQTVMKRLKSEDLENWLEDFTLGELWTKNVFGGGPLS